MPVSYLEKTKIFKLDAGDSTYVLRVADEGYLLGLYWGAKIPDADFEGYDLRDYASSSPRATRSSERADFRRTSPPSNTPASAPGTSAKRPRP